MYPIVTGSPGFPKPLHYNLKFNDAFEQSLLDTATF